MAVDGIGGSTGNSSITGARSGIADNFDTFLQLLTTQLKNQNPLDPLDTNAFTQQLVQFSSVEQQLKTNEFLSALVQSNANSVNTNAVSYIGKTVSAAGTRSELIGGKAVWNFKLDDAAMTTVTIKNAKGDVVYTQQGELQAGSGMFEWDGKMSNGMPAPNGTYTIQMTGLNAEGKNVPITTEFTGTVTGIDFTGTEPILLIGQTRVNISNVTSIRTAPEAPPAETPEEPEA